jgi:site-specific recombinase XerD
MSDIVKVDKAELRKHAQLIAENTKSENTKRGYSSDIDQFFKWLKENELSMDEISVNDYTLYLSYIGRKITTINRALTSISQWHKLQGMKSPVTPRVRETVKGIARTDGTKRTRARPLTWRALDRLLKHVEGNAVGIRDHALLLVGFAGALRRSEIVAIDVEHIEFVDEGMIITQTVSKTNQTGDERKIAIPFVDIKNRCPVKAVRHLIDYAQVETGPLFNSLGSAGRRMLSVPLKGRLKAASVSLIIKRYAKHAGYDPTEYSGHSLRAGFATSASKAGLRSSAIMNHTGHKTHAVMMVYVRDGRAFVNHPFSFIVNHASTGTNSQ